MASNDEAVPDEDTFLTALESKLRVPFSSTELAKFLTPATTPLIAQVLHRAEKVTQLRILTGLLGISSSSVADDKDLASIVRVAQTSPDYEEWVRVVAGIVQSQLGLGEEGGEEAEKTLKQSCSEIIQRVRATEASSAVIDEGPGDYSLGQTDIYPTFCTFRNYFDPNKNQNEDTHAHFVVNADASILHMDAKLEHAKAVEEASHQQAGLARLDSKSTNPSAANTKRQQALLPGGDNSKRKKPPSSRPKSSMFMPTTKRKPSAAAVSKTNKPSLHKRKPGAAQALLNKGRQRRLGGQAATSKMKVMDPDEAAGLVGASAPATTKATKRKAPPESQPKMARAKTTPVVAAVIASPQIASPVSPARQQMDWRRMLEIRSNVLTQVDRERIRLFFEEHTNPDPTTTSYRAKLHEERTPQAKTTYYIELDYTTFKSKQFSKVKKYA